MDAVVQKTGVTASSAGDETYLAPSPYQDDRGFKIGRLPHEISVTDLKGLGGPKSPIKAIRAKCLDCSAGNAAEIRKCVAYGCALWPFRMGRNPFHALARGHEEDAESRP